MRLRKAIAMSEYRRRQRAREFGAERRPRRRRPAFPTGRPSGGASPAPASASAQSAPSWGPSLPVGEHVQVRAKAGYRAAVLELRPGLYLVGEVPADAVAAGAPTERLAQAMLKGATASLGVRVEARGTARGPGRGMARGGSRGRGGFPGLPGAPRLPMPRGGARAAVDVDAEAEVDVEGDDFEGLFGCDRCGGRCGG
ncbi:hypothetical protein L6R50_19850 [Myxococcota bacterium]|nr:hypothetical protein [Myxococcota bacterium]